MSTAWTKLRRLWAGLMLVAALCLALHAGFPAEPAQAGAAGTAAVGQAAVTGPIHSGAGKRIASHHAPAFRHADRGGHGHGSSPCRSTCCGAACIATVLSAPAPLARRVDVAMLVLVPPQDPAHDGVDPAELRRPPSLDAIA